MDSLKAHMIKYANVYGLIAVVGLVLLVGAEAQAQGLQNPLEARSLSELIEGALRALVLISLPIISLFIVYSGFLFISAQGNETKISTAKTNFLYVIVGSIIILGAWALAQLIGGTVDELRG